MCSFIIIYFICNIYNDPPHKMAILFDKCSEQFCCLFFVNLNHFSTHYIFCLHIKLPSQ